MRWWLTVAWLAAFGCGETEKDTQGATAGLGGALAQGGAPDAGAGGVALLRPLPCGEGNFVPPEKICDGTEDCQFGTDERVCPVYFCADGWYLAGSKVCDGTDDCAGAEDERADQCASVPTGFICSGSTRVARREVCDGTPDCDNAADEANCPGVLCFDGERLLPRTKKCDGVSDCADGSDESECTAP
jgi:Low-density lipoprotein receptor domain class A